MNEMAKRYEFLRIIAVWASINSDVFNVRSTPTFPVCNGLNFCILDSPMCKNIGHDITKISL